MCFLRMSRHSAITLSPFRYWLSICVSTAILLRLSPFLSHPLEFPSIQEEAWARYPRGAGAGSRDSRGDAGATATSERPELSLRSSECYRKRPIKVVG